MPTWSELSDAHLNAVNKLENPDIARCPKCGLDMFEVVECKQYRIDQRTYLGQRPPSHMKSPTFYFYRCLCGEIIEPKLQYNQTDWLGKIYLKFVSIVQKVLSGAKS
jgi:hypothetical protein